MAPTSYISVVAVALVVFAPVVHASPLSTYPHGVPQERPIFSVAPLVDNRHPHGSVNNSYMVVFEGDVSNQPMDSHFNSLQMAHKESPLLGDELAAGLRHIYDGHLKGYSGHFSEETIDRIHA